MRVSKFIRGTPARLLVIDKLLSISEIYIMQCLPCPKNASCCPYLSPFAHFNRGHNDCYKDYQSDGRQVQVVSVRGQGC